VAINSYSGLISEINDWCSRADMTAIADTLLFLGEERLSRDLRIRVNEATMNVTIAAGVAPIPADYVQMKHVHISGSPVQPLLPVESTWLFEQYPDRSADAKPKFVAEDGANFVFGPYPDSSTYVLGGAYWKKPTVLSASNTTNEWTSNCPDALFWAALSEAEPWLKNDARVGLWESKYQQAKDRIMRAEKKRTRKGSRIIPDPGVSF